MKRVPHRPRLCAFVFSLLSAVGASAAQTPSLSVSGGTGIPGSSVTLSVNLSLGTGIAPVSVQWDISYSTSDLNPGSGSFFVTGAAAAGAGKTVDCARLSAGDVRCIVSGLNTTALASGVVAQLTFQIPSTTTDTSTLVSLANPGGSDPTANALSITGNSTTVAIDHSATAVTTTTSLGASNLNISAAESTLLTATVQAASGTTSPAGIVTFTLGQNILGAVALSGAGGSAIAALSVSGTNLATGANTIVATYSGGGLFSGSSGSLSVTVVNETPSAVSAAPNSGSGASQTFALKSSDTAGAGSLQQVWVYFNATLARPATQTCLVYYIVATNQINLLNDTATAWLSATLGSAATLQNSQCSLNVGASSVTSSGKTLTLNLAMTFEPAYAGAKNVYLYAGDISGSNSGWQQLGTWTVPGVGTPAAVSVTPSAGAGASQTFALESSDTAGAGSLQQVWVYFNATLARPATQTCLVYYIAAANQINLLNDAATAWLSATLGSAATLQNSQCSLNVGASSVTSSGKTLTLNLAMTFEPAYAGAKNVYMYAGDISGSNSGWQQLGTWTVPLIWMPAPLP